MKKLFTLLTFTVCCSIGWAQQATLKGKVVSAADKAPVPFANIGVVGTSSGGTTDMDGKFELKLNPGTYTIKISSLGFSSKEEKVTLAAGETKTISVEVEKGAIDLGMFTKTEGKYEKKIEEVTVSLDIIRPNIIENKNATSADQALQQTPGLVIVDSEPQLRGGSGYSFGAGSRVMVLVDDLPLLSGDAGRPSWGFIPVENIEQIEVVKGASSVLYGSGALAGVINIRSAFPTNTPKTKVTFFGGIYNIRKQNRWHQQADMPFNTGLSMLHSRKLGKQKEFDLVIGANLFKERGFIGPSGDTSGFFDGSNTGEFENRARMNFNFRHRVRKIEGLSWGLNGNFMYSQSANTFIWKGARADSTYRSLSGTTTKTLQTTFHIDPYVTYTSKNGSTHALRFRYFYLDNNNSNNQGNSSHLFFGEYQSRIVFPKIKDFSITPGIMATYTLGKADLFAGDEPAIPAPFDSIRTNRIYTDNTNLAFYLQVEKKFFKRLTISGGFRMEMFNIGKYDSYTFIDTAANGAAPRDTNIIFTENNLNNKFLPVFRLGINYKVAQETYIRASFGQGYRFPTIAERFVKTQVGAAQVYPNPVLAPERSMNVELGVKQGVKIGNFMGYVDVSGFYQHFNNTIEFTFAQWGQINDPLFGLGFRSVNIGPSRVWGVEGSIMGQGKFTKDVTMNVLIGYTYTSPTILFPDSVFATDSQGKKLTNRSTSDTINSPGGKLLKYRFQHLVRADVEVIWKKLTVGLSFRYNSMMKNIDNAFYFLEAAKQVSGVDASRNPKGDWVMDARIGYEVHKGHKVNFIANNIFNRVYAIRPLAPEAPRYFALQYQVQF